MNIYLAFQNSCIFVSCSYCGMSQHGVAFCKRLVEEAKKGVRASARYLHHCIYGAHRTHEQMSSCRLVNRSHEIQSVYIELFCTFIGSSWSFIYRVGRTFLARTLVVPYNPCFSPLAYRSLRVPYWKVGWISLAYPYRWDRPSFRAYFHTEASYIREDSFPLTFGVAG